MANGLIERAEFNNVGISFNGEQLELSQQLLSVQAQGNDNVSNYMPVRDVLEGMGYTVDWNGGNNMIEVTNKVISTNTDLNLGNNNDDKWVARIDMVSIYGYGTALGANGAGILMNRGDT